MRFLVWLNLVLLFEAIYLYVVPRATRLRYERSPVTPETILAGLAHHGIWIAALAEGAILRRLAEFDARVEFDALAVIGVGLTMMGRTLVLSAMVANPWFHRCVIWVPGQRLVRHGPYRFLSHPAYLGMVISNVGVALLLGALAAWFLCAVYLGIIGRRVWQEMRFLRQVRPLTAVAALIAACALGAGAQVTGIYNQASRAALIAPGTLAVIEGRNLATETVHAAEPGRLPVELGSVRVYLNGHPANLRTVSPSAIVFLAPDVGERILSGVREMPVEIATPFARFFGTALVSGSAPGLFTNPDGAPWGVAQVAGEGVEILANEPLENRATVVSLIGTGVNRANRVTVWIGAARARARAYPFFGFAGMSSVVFTLPMEARGRVMVMVVADAYVSNPISLLLR